jgi:hypothetical protein
MLSKKIIIILVILAILMSAVSIVITLSTLNMEKVPEINVSQGKVIPDSDKGQISLTINKPAGE